MCIILPSIAIEKFLNHKKIINQKKIVLKKITQSCVNIEAMEGTILRSTKTSQMSVATWRKPTVETAKGKKQIT